MEFGSDKNCDRTATKYARARHNRREEVDLARKKSITSVGLFSCIIDNNTLLVLQNWFKGRVFLDGYFKSVYLVQNSMNNFKKYVY